MKKYNPYRNIFYFYRGPSHREKRDIDKQLEDNTTKALINSLEYSNKNLLFNFFKHLNIKIKDSKVVNFDLQVGEDLSRPDALIQIDANNYFIESKIDAPLYRDQIERHLKADSTSFLICITPREKDIEIIKEIGKNNLAFITWSEVYTFFKGQLRIHKEDQTRFLINQFLNYLETINVAPFNGWNKKDFEAFLNLEDDPKRELRIRVKKKLSQYLKELEALVKNEISYKDLKCDVQNIKVKSDGTSGVLCRPPLSKKVHLAHFNFYLNSDAFFMGVQIEGKDPANRMLRNIKKNRDKFLDILRGLQEFHLVIRKRINSSGRPRDYTGIDIINILIQEDISIQDIEYIINKMEKLKLFEIHCGRFYKRDEIIIDNPSFLDISFRILKKLEIYYQFATV